MHSNAGVEELVFDEVLSVVSHVGSKSQRKVLRPDLHSHDNPVHIEDRSSGLSPHAGGGGLDLFDEDVVANLLHQGAGVDPIIGEGDQVPDVLVEDEVVVDELRFEFDEGETDPAETGTYLERICISEDGNVLKEISRHVLQFHGCDISIHEEVDL